VAFIPNLIRFVHRAGLYSTAAALLGAALIAAAAASPDQPPNDSVGAIDGEAIAVTGPMSVDVVNGKVKTVLRSGSDVRVKSGTASIDLIEGGKITICGPAHFSVLKSYGALTIALDTGVILAHLEHGPTLTVFTPQVQAKPIAIGAGPQDVLIGFDPLGAMCVRATRGAVRLEEQLTGGSVLVPQDGDIILTGGLASLRPSSGRCTCEPLVAKVAPPPAPEVSRPAPPEEVRKRAFDPKPVAPAAAPPEKQAVKDPPVYQVMMPPLVFDANSKVPSNFDPKLIIFVRKVRVRPTLIFRGTVEAEPVAVIPPPAPAAAAKTASAKPPAPVEDSVIDRARNYLRNLWSKIW
jgi:hypothetical protein